MSRARDIADLVDVNGDVKADALDNATMSAGDILTAIKTVDGSGSGLDADKLDGLDSTVFAKKTDYATSTVGGTVKARISGSTLYLTTNGTNA
jgi:hypothetical protein